MKFSLEEKSIPSNLSLGVLKGLISFTSAIISNVVSILYK